MSATLAVASWLVAGVEASRPVPAAPTKWSQMVAGPNAYLPTSLPAGYRYAGWKNENTNDTELAEQTLFLVTFADGKARLVWTVSTPSPAAGEGRCGAHTAGHAKVAGKTVYWSGLTTYDPPADGPKGRHVWRCVDSPDGRNNVKLDVFDQGGSLSIPVLSRLVALSTSK
jgi:hypothetical protein